MHERGIVFCFFVFSLVSLSVLSSFLNTGLLCPWLNVLLVFFFLFDAIISGIFLIFVSDCY